MLLGFGDASSKGIESNVANIVVLVEEESAEDVDGQSPEAVVRLDGHDGLNALVEDGIASIFGSIGVGSNLRKDIAHFLRGTLILSPKQAEQGKNLYLEEGIGYAGNVVFRRESAGEEIPQQLHKKRNKSKESRSGSRLVLIFLVVLLLLVLLVRN